MYHTHVMYIIQYTQYTCRYIYVIYVGTTTVTTTEDRTHYYNMKTEMFSIFPYKNNTYI